VAHEFCHLAAWVYSRDIADHGPLWQNWARNISRQFLPPHIHITKYCRINIVRNFHFYCTKCGKVQKLDRKPRNWQYNLSCSKCGHTGTLQQYEPPPPESNPWNSFTQANTPIIKAENPHATPTQVQRIVREAYWNFKRSAIHSTSHPRPGVNDDEDISGSTRL